jgi:hypothetical protein
MYCDDELSTEMNKVAVELRADHTSSMIPYIALSEINEFVIDNPLYSVVRDQYVSH